MALDQSALLEVLDALKAADVGDRVRAATETVYQALIEAECTAAIGAAPARARRWAGSATQRAPPPGCVSLIWPHCDGLIWPHPGLSA